MLVPNTNSILRWLTRSQTTSHLAATVAIGLNMTVLLFMQLPKRHFNLHPKAGPWGMIDIPMHIMVGDTL